MPPYRERCRAPATKATKPRTAPELIVNELAADFPVLAAPPLEPVEELLLPPEEVGLFA